MTSQHWLNTGAHRFFSFFPSLLLYYALLSPSLPMGFGNLALGFLRGFFFQDPQATSPVCCVYTFLLLFPLKRGKLGAKMGEMCVYNNNNKKEESRRPSANFFRLKKLSLWAQNVPRGFGGFKVFFFLIFYLVSTLLYDDRARCVGEWWRRTAATLTQPRGLEKTKSSFFFPFPLRKLLLESLKGRGGGRWNEDNLKENFDIVLFFFH